MAEELQELTSVTQKGYRKGSIEREELTEAIKALKSKLPVRVPITATGKTVRNIYHLPL